MTRPSVVGFSRNLWEIHGLFVGGLQHLYGMSLRAACGSLAAFQRKFAADTFEGLPGGF